MDTLDFQFFARRKQMRQDGYTDKEIQDSYAFLCVNGEMEVCLLMPKLANRAMDLSISK